VARAEEGPPARERKLAESPFEQYVVPEIETLLRVARTLTSTTAEAEDLVQDTLLRAFRGIEGFDGRYPRAWLLTILRNTQINRTRRRRPQLLDDPDQAENTAAIGPESSVEAVVVDSVLDSAIEQCLAELSFDQRQIVQLIDVSGLSYREAAEVAGVPIGTVMSRLHRARRRMRDSLFAAGLGPGKAVR